ncbi:MAG: hypothetical protein B7Z31_13155 [Rhodobacterales bacterium 12-65-15]|nr:MAG: hypothetical protein B7Z31_13155 [Rhodobacterales bacterium 12-65-15]
MTLHPRALVLAALMTAAPVFAQTATDASPPSQDEMQAMMTMPEAFAQRATSSNMFEIMSSELALQAGQSEEVRAFAEQMIADHTAAGERMMVAATAEGLTPTNDLMPDHQAQLDTLSTMTAEEFDAAYLSAQVAAHDEAVTLFSGYASQGAEGPLKAFAAETLPTLEGHLGMAEPMVET